MIRRIAALLAVACALPAGAQIGPRLPQQGRGGAPPYWVGVSYGYVSGVAINDGASQSTWDFGYSSQLQATIEKTVQSGITLGASAGFATAPLTYTSASPGSACARCEAKADMNQYMAFVRGGGGVGFHGLYSLEAGATEFSNFRANADGTKLPPTSAKYDFSFGFGGGLGFGFSATSEVYVAEQFDLILHSQGGGSTSNAAPRVNTFRAGVRIGF